MCATSARSHNLHNRQLQTPRREKKRQRRMCQASVATGGIDERMILEYPATVVYKETLPHDSATSKGYTARRPCWDGNSTARLKPSVALLLMLRLRQLNQSELKQSLRWLRNNPSTCRHLVLTSEEAPGN